MAISPGTWRVSGTREVYSDALPRENCVVAEILDGSDEDAALIAAAPELLAALKKCKQALKNYIDSGYDEDEDQEAYAAAMAALRKAEGRTG
jgi:hypothetical protein